jgi:hypothetical protein
MLRGLESLAPVVTILPQIFLAWSANNAVSLKAAADASRGQTEEVFHEFRRSDQLMLPQLCQLLRSGRSFGVLVLVSFRSHRFDCVWCNR